MQSDHTPHDETSSGSRDSLDDLLRQATWPEATPLQIARLEQQWDRICPRQSSKWSMRVAAFAAALMIGFLCWWSIPQQADNVVVDNPPMQNSVTHQELISDSPDSVPSERPTLASPDQRFVGRPATKLEIVLANAAIQRAERERQRIAADPFERWVARLIADEQLAIIDFDAAVEIRQEFLRRSLAELPSSQSRRRIAIARLLTMLELPDAIPALITLWSDSFTRAVVESHLVAQADVSTLMEMSRVSLTFEEQVRFLTHIAERPDTEAQQLLLLAAMNSRYRRSAMLVARQTHLPPADMLFGALTDQNSDVRFAAALLLGEIDDPHITDRLIDIARQSPKQSEPWVALIRRRDAASRQLMAEVRSDPHMYATLITAELSRQSSLSPIQRGAAL